jgi:hypothetical protein
VAALVLLAREVLGAEEVVAGVFVAMPKVIGMMEQRPEKSGPGEPTGMGKIPRMAQFLLKSSSDGRASPVLSCRIARGGADLQDRTSVAG